MTDAQVGPRESRTHAPSWKALRWRLHLRWQRFITRHFRYRGQYLVGRDVPDVMECHSGHREGHACSQDDGSHPHAWVPCIVTYKDGSHPQVATRCIVCGARKCDMDYTERRHHRGPHHEAGGYRMVGS